jgi:hypothetical protein
MRKVVFQEIAMRLPMMLTALLPLLVWTQPVRAKEPPVEIFLSNDGLPAMTIGEAGADARSFKLKLTSSRSVTFAVDASNETCGYELTKSSQLGFLPKKDRFPLSYTDAAKEGESYTISFYQTRSAWVTKMPCAFSFSIQ